MPRSPIAAALSGLALLASGASAADPEVVDRAPGWGLEFRHENGMTGELYFAEIMGAGGGLVDYDGDGDLDTFLVQGTALGSEAPPATGSHRLYRNDLGNEGTPRFVDVSAQAALPAAGYGMGVTAGDYDGDGFPDLYVTQLGPNQLLRSRGDGTFEERTAAAGVDDPRWTVPAAFFDFDGDGLLDLYVGNYVDFRVATHKTCTSPTGARDYCSPDAYRSEPDRLFRNRGDGTFEDVSSPSGVGGVPGAALGAAVLDADADGRPDLYVANDGEPNFLWRNRGDGTFEDVALLAGVAVNRDGQPEASMGIAAGDEDADGDPDLFVTHLARETNTLYRNDGQAFFEDVTRESGLGNPSWPWTGFGIGQIDADGDGRLDLLVGNGAVTRIEEQLRSGESHPVLQPNQLFLQRAGGRYQEIDSEELARLESTRGAAAGDLDLDGREEVLITNNSGPARIYGIRGAAASVLVVDPVARGATVFGTRVDVPSAAGPILRRWVGSDGSYASSRDPRTYAVAVDPGGPVTLRWPDGARQRIRLAPTSGSVRFLRVERGPSGGPP